MVEVQQAFEKLNQFGFSVGSDTCASHAVAKLPAHKFLECFFHTRDRQLLRIYGLVDTGNTVPGSAAIS
ncbi:MAG: hypothetical protein GY696_33645 [Gammaproteobacteria bacterium]|nr:hypothetical protein [Gammaproteobacteria bacterium]